MPPGAAAMHSAPPLREEGALFPASESALRGTEGVIPGGPAGGNATSPDSCGWPGEYSTEVPQLYSPDSCGWPGEYSTEVPQLAGTRTDRHARCGTVTCGYVLWLMGCLLMACKRSGVRVSVTPQVRS